MIWGGLYQLRYNTVVRSGDHAHLLLTPLLPASNIFLISLENKPFWKNIKSMFDAQEKKNCGH